MCARVNLVRVVDMSSGVSLADICLQETGGLGVDCIVDDGGEWVSVQSARMNGNHG